MTNISKNIAFVRKRQQQNGMTFIEILIALVIIVTGILGAVAMQATAKKASFDAMQRSLASSLAEDMISRIRASTPPPPPPPAIANIPAFLATYAATDYGGDNYPEPAERCLLNTAVCNIGQMLANDQFEWERALMGGDVTITGNNSGGLIGATGCISVAANTVTVAVSWQGREDMTDNAIVANCGTVGTRRRQVVVRVFVI